MKNSVLFGLIVFLLFSCKSSEKLFEEGNYDAAIDKSIKKILKGKADNEDKELLDKAYSLANQRNINNIKILKDEARPENWEAIYLNYLDLNNRQDVLKKVNPLEINGRNYNYQFVDYTKELVESKKKAAEYFYYTGNKFMSQKTIDGYRDAFYNFVKASDYGGNTYPDVNQLINESRELGTTHVLIEVIDQNMIKLPPDYISNILSFNSSNLNTTWVTYDVKPISHDFNYDYYISVILKQVLVSPDNYTSNEYTRNKTVRDGFEYKKDRKGNVMKDSLGNDIKIPKYKDLVCTVVERHQIKSATIQGEVEFVTAEPERVLRTEPVAATSTFEHHSGRAVGDLDALDPEDLAIIRIQAVPFPRDMEIIYNSSSILRQAVYDLILNNRGVFH